MEVSYGFGGSAGMKGQFGGSLDDAEVVIFHDDGHAGPGVWYGSDHDEPGVVIDTGEHLAYAATSDE